MTYRWRFAWAWTIGAVLVAGCPTPQPTPTPPPPPPTPVPTCECTVPGSEDPGWSVAQIDVPYNATFIQIARGIIGDPAGKPPAETLAAVAGELKKQNVCAAGPWADAVLIARPDGLWEEWHVVRYTDGGWASLDGAMKNGWVNSAAKGCK